MEMAQLALQAGLPSEGRRIVEQGFAGGVLGTGAEAERHQRLRDLAVKEEGRDRAPGSKARRAEAADRQGRQRRSSRSATRTSSMGQFDKGIAADRAGHRQGRPEAPRRRQAAPRAWRSCSRAKTKPKAVQTLRSVQGTDGAADIARLWAVYANQTS